MKSRTFRFAFGDGMWNQCHGTYTVARVKAMHNQIVKHGDASCYLEVEQVQERIEGVWTDIENKGV